MTTNDTSQPSLLPNTDVDFIRGRGGKTITKLANAWVLDLVEECLSEYCESEKAKNDKNDNSSKRAVALRIITELHARGGRFLTKGPDGTYHELDNETAIGVVQQKFRDAPKRMWDRLVKEWRERQPKNDSPPTANNDVYSNQANTQYNNNCLSVGVAILQGCVDKTSESLKDFLLKYQVAKRECLEVLEALQSHVDFQAIKKKLEDGRYRSKEEFELDVRRTLDDVMSNNSDGTDAHKCAKAMEDKLVCITQHQTKENAGRNRKQDSQGNPNKQQRESYNHPTTKSVEQQNTPVVEHPSQQPVSLGNDGAREDEENRIRQLKFHLNHIINDIMPNILEGSSANNFAKEMKAFALYFKNCIKQLEAMLDASYPSLSSKRI